MNDRRAQYEPIAQALEASPSIMASEAAAAVRNLASRLDDAESENAAYRARLATAERRLSEIAEGKAFQPRLHAKTGVAELHKAAEDAYQRSCLRQLGGHSDSQIAEIMEKK